MSKKIISVWQIEELIAEAKTNKQLAAIVPTLLRTAKALEMDFSVMSWELAAEWDRVVESFRLMTADAVFCEMAAVVMLRKAEEIDSTLRKIKLTGNLIEKERTFKLNKMRECIDTASAWKPGPEDEVEFWLGRKGGAA